MKLDRATAHRPEPTNPDGLVDVAATPYEANGRIFIPANELAAGTSFRTQDEAMMVQLEMSAATAIGNQLGMFVRLTPDGARLMARRLIENANKVDAHVAEQAAAAIEAARTGGAA